MESPLTQIPRQDKWSSRLPIQFALTLGLLLWRGVGGGSIYRPPPKYTLANTVPF